MLAACQSRGLTQSGWQPLWRAEHRAPAEALLPARDDLFVVDVVRNLPPQRKQDGLGAPFDAGLEAAAEVAGDHVRREQYLVPELPEPAARRERLVLEDV